MIGGVVIIIIYPTWRNIYYRMNMDIYGIHRLQSEVRDFVKRLETLEQENMVLHLQNDNIESRVNKLQVRINKIETQMDLFEKEFKNKMKQEILEEMDRWIANATKKKPGLWEHIRTYFRNKKVQKEVMEQLR